MSTIKQRLENATAELADATQTIHDLPDYPDLENIYGESTTTTLIESLSLPANSVVQRSTVF